ncbi:MAG: DNA-binding response regulator [Halobacteriovoraceae bacterium]|nr:DNA-binding response regulator [Halobacteriovoraceae bacterium]MBC98941.1 DNA-binding response regulator [Halobacteriovoraceae bacterium]|tara:strand:- start:1653 stop:2324 length:672 start_codon:yes stop_codon:yes gene_type:complete
MKKILLVEDDPILGDGLQLFLELENFEVTWAKKLSEARAFEEENQFDLVILDLGLPDGSGMDFCKSLRQKGSSLSIIILTAQADEDSVVEGLTHGANDYVRKPFSNRELLARIMVQVKGAKGVGQQIKIDELILSLEERVVTYKGEPIKFNRREFEILKIMGEREGAVISRETIIEKAGHDLDISDRTIDSHISHIRSKLRKANVSTIQIASEYGIGYRLVTV